MEMAFVNYLLSCLIGILACFAVGTGGREAIVYGFPVFKTYQFPYQVSVQDHQHRHVCGGGVVNRRYILTAANCVMDGNRRFINGSHYILAGTIDLNDTAAPAETIQVARIYVPRAYNPRGYVADIALLKLQHRLKKFTRNNAFLRMPISDVDRKLTTNETGMIAGFGWNHVNLGGMTGSTDGQLRYVGVQILVGKPCEDTYSPGTVNASRHFCARMNVEHPRRVRHFGACKSDEGAPLVLDHDRPTLIAGILIRRSPFCDERDHRGYPGIYTRVSHYWKFIDDVLLGKTATDILQHP